MVMNAERNEDVSFVVAKEAVGWGWAPLTVTTCQLHRIGGAGQFGEQKNKNSQGSDLELWESAGKGRREEALTKYQQPNNESCAAIWKEIKPSRETCKQAHEICYEGDCVFKGFF